jgi:hypothetical protein
MRGGFMILEECTGMEAQYCAWVRWELNVLEMICTMGRRDLFLDEEGDVVMVCLSWRWEMN